MGFGLNTKKKKKKKSKRQALPQKLQPCFLSICPTLLTWRCQLCHRWGGSSLLPSIQQLLDTPAAEEDVGNFLKGALQALPPGAHLYNRHSEPSVWQGPSKGEG